MQLELEHLFSIWIFFSIQLIQTSWPRFRLGCRAGSGIFQTLQVCILVPAMLWFLVVEVVKMLSDRIHFWESSYNVWLFFPTLENSEVAPLQDRENRPLETPLKDLSEVLQRRKDLQRSYSGAFISINSGHGRSESHLKQKKVNLKETNRPKGVDCLYSAGPPSYLNTDKSYRFCPVFAYLPFLSVLWSYSGVVKRLDQFWDQERRDTPCSVITLQGYPSLRSLFENFSHSSRKDVHYQDYSVLLTATYQEGQRHTASNVT